MIVGMTVVEIFSYTLGNGKSFFSIILFVVGVIFFVLGFQMCRIQYRKQIEAVYKRFKAKKIEDKNYYKSKYGSSGSFGSSSKESNDASSSYDSEEEEKEEEDKEDQLISVDSSDSGEDDDNNDEDEDEDENDSDIEISDRISEKITSFENIIEICK